MVQGILLQNTRLIIGNTKFTYFYNCDQFYLYSINNCPRNPRNAEIKKIITDLQTNISKLELKTKNLEKDAANDESYKESLEKEISKENGKLKEKIRQLKEECQKSKSENEEMVILP